MAQLFRPDFAASFDALSYAATSTPWLLNHRYYYRHPLLHLPCRDENGVSTDASLS
jgi:hypothetical protein